MADDEQNEEEELHNSDEELHNSDEESDEAGQQEESDSFLTQMNRRLNEDFAKNLPSWERLARKAGDWGSEGRDLERRKVNALELLVQDGHRLPTELNNQLFFTKDDLERFVEHRKTGVAPKSIDWIKRSSKMVWESTSGEISHRTVTALREDVLNKYKSAYSHTKVLGFAVGFLKFLAHTKIEPRYTSFTIYLERPRSVKERKRVTSRIVTEEDIANVLTYIHNAEKNGKINSHRAQDYAAFVIFGAYTGQRSQATMAKLTVGQFREALAREKPVLLVLAEQDKIRMSHFTPLHPAVVEAVRPLLEGRNDDELMFRYSSFWMWAKRQKIPMSQFDGYFQLGDMRKWFEQHSDAIQMNESIRAHITTHGVSGVAYGHYRNPQKEVVYDVYMDAWRDVDLAD